MLEDVLMLTRSAADEAVAWSTMVGLRTTWGWVRIYIETYWLLVCYHLNKLSKQPLLSI
jgi:hypothetical protein